MKNRNVHSIRDRNRIEAGEMRRTRLKSVTGRALSVSLIFHLLFFAAIFYFLIKNELTSLEPVGIQVELMTVVKPLKPLPPKKELAPPNVAHRVHTTSRQESSPAEAENIAPEIGIRLDNRAKRPPDNIEPRLKQENVLPERPTELSTTSPALRELNPGGRKTQASGGVEIDSSGSKWGVKNDAQGRGASTRKLGTAEIWADDGTGAKDDWAGTGDEATADKTEPEEKTLVGDEAFEAAFIEIMKGLAHHVVDTSGAHPVDVVFIIDASGSMRNSIGAVADYLIEMIDVYEASNIDYALGLTTFRSRGRKHRARNTIDVRQLTTDFLAYKERIRNIVPGDDENALDALVQTVQEIYFRPASKKHFILVTDELFTSITGVTIPDVINSCRKLDISVNVLGFPLGELIGNIKAQKAHRALVEKTGGTWHLIPGLPKIVYNQGTLPLPQNPPDTWDKVQQVIYPIFDCAEGTAFDIILFIDGSESMDGKLHHFLREFHKVIQQLNRAAIDYQLGAVRFHTSGTVNRVTVFNPPQPLGRLHKIAALPCRGDENLFDAVHDGLRRIKLRPHAQPYLIVISDEPAKGEYSPAAIVNFIQRKGAIVTTVGAYNNLRGVGNGISIYTPGRYDTNKPGE